MTTKTMYILLSHGEINGHLCSNDGVVSYICPNYVKISPEPLKSEDANTHCHAIQVPATDIKEVSELDGVEYWHWKGPHAGRYNEGDKGTLPISNALGAEEIAASAPSPLPLAVQLAAMVVQMSEEELDAWPNMGEVSVKEWKDTANCLLNKFASENE